MPLPAPGRRRRRHACAAVVALTLLALRRPSTSFAAQPSRPKLSFTGKTLGSTTSSVRWAAAASTPGADESAHAPSRWTLVAGISFWYIVNVYFSIFSKQALALFPHAWAVSVLQLLTVVACSAVGWAAGMIPRPSSSPKLWRWLLPAALAHAIGNGLTAVALSWGSVSFMHVVKTSEPLWMALGVWLVDGKRLPLPQFLAVLPIVCGVALAGAGEVSFTWLGFLAAVGSTVGFAARGVFTKGLMREVTPLNAFALDSLLALAFTLPLAAVLDGPGITPCSPQAAWLLLGAGLAYYAYNAVAFQLLGLLDVVSWAVVNLGKRIVVIGWSIVALSTPLTFRAVLGSTLAIAGSGLYSYVKAVAP